MTAKQKKILKTVGIVSGVLLLGLGIYAIYRKRTAVSTYYPENSKSSPSPGQLTYSAPSESTYSKEQIKQMQSWLLSRALVFSNKTIYDAIQSTGGIDGVMGSGFQKALTEAKRQGWVKDLSDLYEQSKN